MGSFAPGSKESIARGHFKADTRKRCASPECDNRIPADRGTQRPADYCSVKCRDRARYLRHREDRIAKQKARNERGHEARLEWQRAYYAANRDAISAKRKQERAERLAAWLYEHPRCCVCNGPLKRLNKVTCSRTCASVRSHWFGSVAA